MLTSSRNCFDDGWALFVAKALELLVQSVQALAGHGYFLHLRVHL